MKKLQSPGRDRRLVLALLAAGASGAPLLAKAAAPMGAPAAAPMDHSAHNPMPGRRPVVAMLVYPNMVLMDLVGPQTTLKIAQCDIHLVWKTKTPCITDVDIPVLPTTTFEECPRDLDVIFVPGGIMGTAACMDDPEVLAFLADRGSRAKYVTSVCTGAMVLGAAGLLKGYRAATLWAIQHLLPEVGAIPSDERVAVDRNRITGGGVTAGIDFGLVLAAKLRDEETARRAQLIIQYDPQPPFGAGTPKGAGPELTAKVVAARTTMDEGARQAAARAKARLGV